MSYSELSGSSSSSRCSSPRVSDILPLITPVINSWLISTRQEVSVQTINIQNEDSSAARGHENWQLNQSQEIVTHSTVFGSFTTETEPVTVSSRILASMVPSYMNIQNQGSCLDMSQHCDVTTVTSSQSPFQRHPNQTSAGSDDRTTRSVIRDFANLNITNPQGPSVQELNDEQPSLLLESDDELDNGTVTVNDVNTPPFSQSDVSSASSNLMALPHGFPSLSLPELLKQKVEHFVQYPLILEPHAVPIKTEPEYKDDKKSRSETAIERHRNRHFSPTMRRRKNNQNKKNKEEHIKHSHFLFAKPYQ